MKNLGCIHIEKDMVIIDAEPHVMMIVRKIFSDSSVGIRTGRFTHKTIMIPLNNSNAKDIVWVSQRYPFEFDNCWDAIKKKADDYDAIANAVSIADTNGDLLVSENSLITAIDFRDHQIKFINMANHVKRLLLSDVMGMGKTISAIGTCLEPQTRPVLVVCPPHLCKQWEREIKRTVPDASTHIIKGHKIYSLPFVDFLITAYTRIKPWEDFLFEIKFETLIFDEVHELRKTLTEKRKYCRKLSEMTPRVIGLSGTPILNYGIEIWSVLDVIKPNCMGYEHAFAREWCVQNKVREPAILSSFLKTQGLMLRRTPEDIGLKFGESSKHIFTLDSDLDALKDADNIFKKLAMSILSSKIGESDVAEREFDYKLRQATGIAKAKPVAEFVRMMCEQGEKVLLVGWHRDCYDVWMKDLHAYNPVMFTGSESQEEKNKSVQKFINDEECKVFIISLRSGAGLDGLQYVCNNVVFGELDWSPHIMDQVIARLHRDGQTKHVQAFYLTINDGSDPFVMQALNIKRSQHDGIVVGKQAEASFIDTPQNPDRVKEMAKSYLLSIGEEIPNNEDYSGLLGEVAKVLKGIKIPSNTESEMQEAVFEVLKPLFNVQREVSIGKRSRLDFMIENDTERIAIECKIDSTNRPAVYKQIRRYIEEAGITSAVLLAPWFGIGSFEIDGIKVAVIDFTVNSI